MKVRALEAFAFKFDHHYRLGGHTDAPNRLPSTDYYFEPHWRHAYSRLTESCLIKVTTDEGLVGWGESQAPLVPEVPATLVAKLLGPAILGLEATDPEAVYDRLYHLNHVRGHTTSFTIDAIAGIDIALWDIRAQAEGRPLGRLLSETASERLPLYVSGLRRAEATERLALAQTMVDEGFTGVKIFAGGTPAATIAECSAVRTAIGAKAGLALDAICRQDYEGAREIGLGLDELGATWFESPIDPEDVDGHVRLARAIRTPLAVGEPLRTLREFTPWIERDAMRIAQPDIARCGITGGMQIAGAALASGLRVAPHVGVCTAIGLAATWHVTAALVDPESQEHQHDLFPAQNSVLSIPLRVEKGEAIVPTGSGLGIMVNEEFVRANSPERWVVSAYGLEYLRD